MSGIQLSRVIRADAADLIAANSASQDYHLPWVTSFTDQTGFDNWFSGGLTGSNVGLIAREVASIQIAGVVNINEIVNGRFSQRLSRVLRNVELRPGTVDDGRGTGSCDLCFQRT
ncbi:hypothetical protein OKW27_002498 [Paraburkholderia sp. 35.1]